MKHQFNGTKCAFCGVSIAVSGYSEECPARPNNQSRSSPRSTDEGLDFNSPAATRPPRKILSTFKMPKPGQTKCPRCEEYAWFNSKKNTSTTGFVGLEGPLGFLVGKPIDDTYYTQVCGNCGFEMLK